MISGPVASVLPALSGVANRLVFVGLDTCEDLLAAVPAGHRPPARRVQALSTVGLGRLGAELVDAGMRRVRRTREGDVWALGPGAPALEVVDASVVASDDIDAVVLEYAVLITRSVAVGSASVRCATPVPQLALWWRRHVQGGRPLWDSPPVEDIIEIIARRPALDAELGAAPAELRVVIAEACAVIASHPMSGGAIERALVEPRETPGLAEHIRLRIAALARIDAGARTLR